MVTGFAGFHSAVLRADAWQVGFPVAAYDRTGLVIRLVRTGVGDAHGRCRIGSSVRGTELLAAPGEGTVRRTDKRRLADQAAQVDDIAGVVPSTAPAGSAERTLLLVRVMAQCRVTRTPLGTKARWETGMPMQTTRPTPGKGH